MLGLVFAAVLGFVSGGYQVFRDFAHEADLNDEIANQVVSVAQYGAAEAAFQRDRQLAKRTVDGLMTYDFVRQVSIVDDFGEVLGSAMRAPSDAEAPWLSRFLSEPLNEISIDLSHERTGQLVGTLLVVEDRAIMLEPFYSRAVAVIVFELVRSIALALLLLAVFNRFLTRPLTALAQRVGEIDPRNPKPLELPQTVERAGEEISAIAHTTKNLIDANSNYLEELLAVEMARDEANRQLAHSDRLRAVGQLTGGIAHDFNNILSVILGNIELISDRDESKVFRPQLDQVEKASERAAHLTQQLLVYSRRHPLAPEPIDVRAMLGNIDRLLARTVGEQYDLQVVSSAGIWRCFADEKQLETVLFNLAINARDAMPNGGNLTIEAYNVRLDEEYADRTIDITPGQHVCFACTDNGAGMPEDVRERAFEPFFTTKPEGHGSGLGLSMAYGFAKQSGGHIDIYSELGRGTTVKLYMPRHLGEAPRRGQLSDMNDAPGFSGLRVLVVEDDEAVRDVVIQQLQSLQLDVSAAADANKALEICREDEKGFDVFLLDVILSGGMNGRELADILNADNPDTPIVFMSGYTENAIVHDSRLDYGVILLQKPFSRRELRQKLKEALEG